MAISDTPRPDTIDEMLRKLDLLADARGALRCGLIWDLTCGLKALKQSLEEGEKRAES